MAKGDSTTTDIDLLIREADVVDGEDSLAGESLVDLIEVDVVLRDTGFRECFRNRECRADAAQTYLIWQKGIIIRSKRTP